MDSLEDSVPPSRGDSSEGPQQEARRAAARDLNQPQGEEQSRTTTSKSEASAQERIWLVTRGMLMVVFVLLLMYAFICSLDLLTKAMRLIAGRMASDVFAKCRLLSNPIVGVMVGCLVTVLVQSSSTSTSIIVSMVASKLLQVRAAIPLMMGANIGTSITNDVVSLTQFADRTVFRRAFGGACVYDMFNILNIVALLSLELIVQALNPTGEGYLEYLTAVIVNSTHLHSSNRYNVQFLRALTRPVTDRIVTLDEHMLEEWAQNSTSMWEKSLIIRNCSQREGQATRACASIFGSTKLRDDFVGAILLALSLMLLSACLFGMIRIFLVLLKGPVAARLCRVINGDFPVVPWLTGYLVILAGCGLTVLVQSSSVFTSALTPLVGAGALSLERMYEVTIGSNIGTTMTAILAALAVPESRLQCALQVALIHCFFNLSGMLLFYVVPAMRFPVPLARRLSKTTAKYRWFALAYMLFAYIILPFSMFGISALGSIAVYTVAGIIGSILLFVFVVSGLQRYQPTLLPTQLRSWENIVAEPCRSLEPYDKFLVRIGDSFACWKKKKPLPEQTLDIRRHPVLSFRKSWVDENDSSDDDEDNMV